jgi:hypothetical protein
MYQHHAAPFAVAFATSGKRQKGVMQTTDLNSAEEYSVKQVTGTETIITKYSLHI